MIPLNVLTEIVNEGYAAFRCCPRTRVDDLSWAGSSDMYDLRVVEMLESCYSR